MPLVTDSKLGTVQNPPSAADADPCLDEQRGQLVELLLGVGVSEFESAFHDHSSLVNRELAYLLKDECLRGWTSDTARAQRAAAVLAIMDSTSTDPEVIGCAHWGQGVALLASGRMEDSLTHLDQAARQFATAGLPATAAATRVSKLTALAMLGRYEEAIECGLSARETLAGSGDLLSLGKIEHNLGNIYLRREYYGQAEVFLGQALERFAQIGDVKQQTMVQVNLAFIRTIKNDFRAAEELYHRALDYAVTADLRVNRADIESNLGTLALFQGKYDRALEYLESARGRFAALAMPHKSATAEQELADAYLELNLVPEAADAYDRAGETFYQLGLRAERAQVLAQRGQAAAVMGDLASAHRYLSESQMLFAAEGNHLGAARVQLFEAEVLFAENEFAGAAATASAAEVHLDAAGIRRQAIRAQWLRGEALRCAGDLAAAEPVLRRALIAAEQFGPPRIATACNTSLGLLFGAMGDSTSAEAFFRSAVQLIEQLRAPLPADEFRTAFLASNLTPYHELMRICLEDPGDRKADAFEFCERARSRALAELLEEGQFGTSTDAESLVDPATRELAGLREELSWYYNQLNRPFGRTQDELAELQNSVRSRETRLAEIARRRELHSSASGAGVLGREFDLSSLQRQLGTETALVEYVLIDGAWAAFVVTGDEIEVVRDLANAERVNSALNQFRFQIDSLRFGAEAMRRHLPRLTAKVQVPLRELHDELLAPLQPWIGNRRLVVVPQGELHYVPFHALFDGAQFTIEQREVIYSPSASVLAHCLNRPWRTPERAVLLGVPAAETPQVLDEIAALAKLLDRPAVLWHERAVLAELRSAAPGADLLHLACHGQFRPDNPLFSTLRLADEWITARDVCGLDLRRCGLVTLSACETGMNGVNPGDEIMGLSRGFFRAGAAALILSQWVVDDRSTAEFMIDLYRNLSLGKPLGTALRSAQRAALQREPHPFFWSPFILMGRW